MAGQGRDFIRLFGRGPAWTGEAPQGRAWQGVFKINKPDDEAKTSVATLAGEVRRLREALEKVAALKSHENYRFEFEALLDDAIKIAENTLSYDATKASYLNVNAKPDV